MKKKWIFLIPVALLLAGCTVERLNNVFSKGTDGMASPSWDVDFKIPLGNVKTQLSKIDEVKTMLNSLKFTDDESIANGEDALIHVKIDDMQINNDDFDTIDDNVKKAIDSDSVLTWPLPIGRTKAPEIRDTSIPTIKLDLDDDKEQDMMLTELKSEDGSLKIKLKMQLEDLDGTLRDATRDDYFDEKGIPYIAIEDVTDDDGTPYSIEIGDRKFSFKDGVYEDGKLVFETSNFLTNYAEPIKPTPKLDDDTKYEYRISIPEDALKIRGRNFDVIEDALKQNSSDSNSGGSRSVVSRGANSEKLTADEIKAKLQTSNGDKRVLEEMLTKDGVTIEDIAEAYEGNLEKVLEDSDLSIKDIMTSDIIASDENLETFGKEDGGFGAYTLFEDTTLGQIESAGNLKSLADFCKFHETHAVKSIKFSLEVEVDLGDSFAITAEIIKDYEITVDTGDSLPLSKLDKVLENATLEADISHNFMAGAKIKNPKIGDKAIAISGIGSDNDGYYTIPENACHITFDLNEMPSEDGGVELSLIIPEETTVNIALNPTSETDLYLDMTLGANGTFKVNVDEISSLLGGE